MDSRLRCFFKIELDMFDPLEVPYGEVRVFHDGSPDLQSGLLGTSEPVRSAQSGLSRLTAWLRWSIDNEVFRAFLRHRRADLLQTWYPPQHMASQPNPEGWSPIRLEDVEV